MSLSKRSLEQAKNEQRELLSDRKTSVSDRISRLGRPRVGDRVSFRVGKKYHAFIVTQAMKKRLTPSGYVRKMVKAEVERVWNEEHSSGATHLEALSNLAKQYIIRVRMSRQVSKVPMKAEKGPRLPGAEHRDDLEELAWQAVQEAVTYSKTEGAATDAESRLLALRVTNGLMRTELAILKDQDDAFVDTLLEELGVDADGLAKKTRKES